MSGGSSQQTAQLDPALRDAYLQNVQSAQGVAAGLAPRQFAGYNQDQLTGAQITRNFADPNSEVFTGMRTAFDTAGQVAAYQPQNVRARSYTGATVDPAALAAQQGYNEGQTRILQSQRALNEAKSKQVKDEKELEKIKLEGGDDGKAAEREEEKQKEAELPINKRIPPCAGHDFQEQQD